MIEGTVAVSPPEWWHRARWTSIKSRDARPRWKCLSTELCGTSRSWTWQSARTGSSGRGPCGTSTRSRSCFWPGRMPTPSGCPPSARASDSSDGSERAAVHVTIGPGGQTVDAPIAPGVVTTVPVSAWKLMDVGDGVDIGLRPCTIALDGERACERPGRNRPRRSLEGRRPARRGREKAIREATRLGVFAGK